jgi:hypothetical protein
MSEMAMFRQSRAVAPVRWFGANYQSRRRDENRRTVCDSRANPAGVRSCHTIRQSCWLGRFRRLAWHWVCTSAQFRLHRAGDHVVLHCQHLLAMDAAVQSHRHVVAFFTDNNRYRCVLAGILSSAQLTDGDMGRLRSSSRNSFHSGNFRLESHSSSIQAAATA